MICIGFAFSIDSWHAIAAIAFVAAPRPTSHITRGSLGSSDWLFIISRSDKEDCLYKVHSFFYWI